MKRKEKKPLQIGSTTIIPLKSGDREVQRFQLGEEEFSDRDEADASDDDMEVNHIENDVVVVVDDISEYVKDEADDDGKESGANSSKSSNENSRNGDEDDSKRTVAAGDDGDEDSDKKEGAKDVASDGASRVAVKQPCILVFDSLAGGSKAKVAQTLR